MTFSPYYVRSEVIAGRWTVDIADLDEPLNNGREVMLIDPFQRQQLTLRNDELHEFLDSVDRKTHTKIAFKDNEEEYMLDPYHTYLLQHVHHTWYNALLVELNSIAFRNLIGTIKQIREKMPVTPEHSQILAVFTMDIRRIRVVWLGLSPYPTEGNANGYAFATYQKAKPSSLKILQEGIRNDLKLGIKWTLQNDLKPLIDQGVFLLNAALTTANGDPISHLAIWAPFMKRVIEILAAHSDIAWVFWGKYAQSFVQYLQPGTKYWFETHPMAYTASQQAMTTTVFTEQRDTLGINFEG